MAGATAVGVGTAVYEGGPNIMTKIAAEMEAWLTSHNTTLEAIRGAAL
jgi:dihydroorotate dehydrogenase